MNIIKIKRELGDYGFTATDEKGHTLQTDSGSDAGGLDAGYRPMQLLLVALGSCSAIDVVSILKKQHQQLTGIEMVVTGERETGSVPTLWKNISVTFHLSGHLDEAKARRAAALSMEKYCSVAETMRRAGTLISWKTIINEK